MFNRIVVLGLMVSLTGTLFVQADKLILKDGRTLSGKVTIEKDDRGERFYRIVTDGGETLTLSRDEVEHFKRESDLSDWDLLQAFEEWQDLVTPILELPEPKQREFLTEWHEYSSRLATSGSREVWEDVRARLWETPVNSDKFVDEWSRYAAEFKAVRESLKYKKLLSRKTGSNSLKEYTMHPPQGREELAKALKTALDTFEACLDSAERTNNLVRNLPREQVKQARMVRNRQSEAVRAMGKRSTHRDAMKRHEENRKLAQRAARKDAEVYQAVMHMANTLERKTQNADAEINRFSQERVVTHQHVVSTGREVEELGSREGGARSTPHPGSAAPLLPIGAITREFRRVIDSHRTNAKDLTSVGLKALRERTLAEIQDLYVGQQFTLQLDVTNIKEAGGEGFVLLAEHSADWGEKVARTVEFQFDAGVKHELIKCKKGAKIEIVARVKRVFVDPELPLLETSSQNAGVHLAGDIVAVKTGCKWQ